MINIIRKIGKFLRGSSSPFQIYTATLLSGWMGFTTQGMDAIGLTLFLFAGLLFLNANLFVAGISLIAYKILFWLLLPVLFSSGIFLLHGPLESPVSTLSSLPVLAWFGLDLYVQIPGLILGTLAGIATGFVITRGLRKLRQNMAALETDSSKWTAAKESRWIQFTAWIFFGGLEGKKSWSELASQKKGMPIRPLGMVAFVLAMFLLWIGWKFLDSTILTTQLQSRLEPVNGASIDIASLIVDPAEQEIRIEDLAIADPENLSQNRFEAKRIVLNISGTQLLAKRIELDSIEILGGAVQTPRTLPAVRVGPTPKPSETVSPDQQTSAQAQSIFDYLPNAATWKARLETASRWIERVQGQPVKEETATETDTAKNWRQSLAERAALSGYAQVVATHLNRPHPRILIRSLQSEPIRVGNREPEWTLSGSNIASEPALTTRPGTLEIKNVDSSRHLELELPTRTQAYVSLSFEASEIDVDALHEQTGGKLPLQSGTMDLSMQGVLNPQDLYLPITAHLHQTSLQIGGKQMRVKDLKVPLTLSGSLRNPRISTDRDFAKELLKEAAQDQIQNIIQDKAGDKLKKFLPFGR